MSAKELLRIAAVVLVLVGIYQMLHAKSQWMHVLALAALAVLLIDVSKWAQKFGTAVSDLVQGISVIGGVAA